MEDYYKILNLDYKISVEEFNNLYIKTIQELKIKHFLNEDDEVFKKNLKKAHFIFNSQYKSVYDNHINNIIKFNLNKSSKKDLINNNQITDRIFSINNTNTFNIEHNELLRPKNVGIINNNL